MIVLVIVLVIGLVILLKIALETLLVIALVILCNCVDRCEQISVMDRFVHEANAYVGSHSRF